MFGTDATLVLATVHAVLIAYAEIHGRMLNTLHFLEERLRKAITEQNRISEESLKNLIKALELVRKGAVELEYNETASHIEHKIKEIENNWHTPEDLPSDVKNIRERFADEAKKMLLFRVAAEGVKYHDQLQIFGVDVAKKFPDAQEDLTAAGTCYSLGCTTACVLHLMRALESVLHTLAGKIGASITIGHKDTMGMIAMKLKAYSTSLPSKTPTDADYKNKISSAAMHFQDITNALRNQAMHTGEFFSPTEAEHALVSTKLFLYDLLDLI